MGIVPGVGFDQFPKQDTDTTFGGVGARVRVCFNYDSSREIGGEVVRADEEAPGRKIIKLDDGRHVLTSECMWSPSKDPKPATEHQCPACPVEIRNLGATMHNLIGQLRRNETALQPRSLRKLADAEAALERYTQISDAHFAAISGTTEEAN